MAALKNNGAELARVEIPRAIGFGATHTVKVSLRDSGRILVNYGLGWKLLDGYSKNAPMHDRQTWRGSPAERMHVFLMEPGAKLVAGAIPEMPQDGRDPLPALKSPQQSDD